MMINVKKAGTASPRYFQLISTTFLIMRDPLITKAPPVAHAGILAKMGAKKMEMKKQTPLAMAVKPVFPPSEIPCSMFKNNNVLYATTHSGTFDESSNGRSTEEGTNRDGESVNAVGNCAILKVGRLLVHDTSKASHGVKCTSGIHDIAINQSAKGVEVNPL